jgi:hypothetical protein
LALLGRQAFAPAVQIGARPEDLVDLGVDPRRRRPLSRRIDPMLGVVMMGKLDFVAYLAP